MAVQASTARMIMSALNAFCLEELIMTSIATYDDTTNFALKVTNETPNSSHAEKLVLYIH